MKRQNLAQKISVVFAYLFYFCALLCIGGAGYYYTTAGGQHPSVAAFSAAVVFFIGAGIVLHVMGRADIPDLRLK